MSQLFYAGYKINPALSTENSFSQYQTAITIIYNIRPKNPLILFYIFLTTI